MRVLVYAISTDDARASAASELDEICAAGLRALAEQVPAPPPASRDELVRYESTVETIMRTHTILPMDFGSVFESDEDVRELLRSNAAEFLDALMRGCGGAEPGREARGARDDDLHRDDGARRTDRRHQSRAGLSR